MLKCFISGVEYELTDKYSIREQAGQTASSQLDVTPITGPVPVSWQSVVLESDEVPIFFGLIQSVDTPVFSSRYNRLVYPLTVLSGECIFNNRIASEAYSEKYTHEIIDDLFDNYLLEEGLTKGVIGTFDRYYEKYIIPRLSLQDVFKELGDAVGAVARISPDRVFSFTAKEDFPAVAIPATIANIKKSESGQSLRTVQYVSGANTETSEQTKVATWSSNQTEQLLPYQVSDFIGASINGTPVGVGLKGVDEADALKAFLWRYGENVVIVNANATTKPAAGDTVAFVYYGFYSIEIAEENESLKSEIGALYGGSGKIEAVEVDTAITNYADGKNTAADLLRENGVREETITCQCEDSVASVILNSWTFNYPEISITGEYVIVERTITNLYDRDRVALKLKNRGFYSRYGTVLNKNDKQIKNSAVRTDDVIIKRSGVKEIAGFVDSFGNLGYTPTVYPGTDGRLFDSMIMGQAPYPSV